MGSITQLVEGFMEFDLEYFVGFMHQLMALQENLLEFVRASYEGIILIAAQINRPDHEGKVDGVADYFTY